MKRSGYRCALLLLPTVLTLFAAAAAGLTQDPAMNPRYFMSVFAYETNPRAPQSAHTFATFVKTEGKKFEAHTISWLPKSDDIKLLKRPEAGVNLDLKTTLEKARATEAKVTEWGPYEIKPELYQRALKQIELLNSGRVLYKAIDRAPRPGMDVSNCIHAVMEVDPDGGRVLTGAQFGVDASEAVVEHLAKWTIDPKKVHPEINEKLGLGKGIKPQSKKAPK